MKKLKLWVELFVIVTIIFLIPNKAFANTINPTPQPSPQNIILTPSDNNTIIIVSGVVSISSNHTVKLQNISIRCAPGTHLTLNNVYIDNSASISAACPVTFTGSGILELNFLILEGINTLIGSEGYSVSSISAGEPGIKVENSTYLHISGDGSLTVNGGFNSAGIGSSEGVTCGNIFISKPDGFIYATGGEHGAGIGGGAAGNAGYIDILEGNIVANAGRMAAAIGGGSGGNGGYIRIRSGDITANGNMATGIGSGYSAGAGAVNSVATGIGGGFVSGGEIHISGGDVKAYGGQLGAGIGYWYGEGTDDIRISGGTVYASSANPNISDIGNCEANTTASSNIFISGSSIVFVRNGIISPDPSTSHIYNDNLLIDSNNLVCGKTIPVGWTQPIKAYSYAFPNLIFDANGGLGTLPESVIQFPNTIIQLPDPMGLENTGYDFLCWSETTGGSSGNYNAGQAYVFGQSNQTLYAQWAEKIATGLSLSKNEVTMKTGQYINISADVTPSDVLNAEVIWSSGNTAVAVVDSSGKIVAVSEGMAAITAMAVSNSTVSDECLVSVVPSSDFGDFVSQKETFQVGESIDFISKLSPDDSKSVDLGWISTNPSVASVDAKGRVTCKGIGSTEIIALSKENKSVIMIFLVSIIDEEKGTQPNSKGSDIIMNEKSNVGLLDKTLDELRWILLIGAAVIVGVFIISFAIISKLRNKK